MAKMWCIKLAASCLITAVGGCSQIPSQTGDTGKKPVITSYTMPSESEASQKQEAPIMIWQYQDLKVDFGRITENVGYLKLGLTGRDDPNYVMKKRYMYCLSGTAGNYELRRIDLDQLDKSAVAKIKIKDGTCSLLDSGIRIDTQGMTIFYDFSFHEIHRTASAGDAIILVPFKDGYLIKNGAEIRILHLDEEQPYRVLDSKNYVITRYHQTAGNAYLVLKDASHPELQECTVYDVVRNVYWRKLIENTAINDTGMVRCAYGKYYVSDFAKKKSSVYKSKNPGRIGSSLFDGGRQYYFDNADCKIKYYVPSTQKICVLSEAEFTKGATLKGIYNGYVYADYAGTIYFIDTKGLKETTAEAYAKKIQKEAAAMKKNLEFHYRIKIMSGKDVIKPAEGNAKLEAINIDLEKITAMNRLSKVLKKLNYNFFEVFKQSKKDGVIVMLSGKIDVTDDKSGVPGFSFTAGNAFYVVVDVRSGDVENAFCRELMHTIEHRMVNSDQVFGDWNRYNPEDFMYSAFTAGSAETPYVPETESDVNNVYFTDSYAYASAYEDRARLFAAMFMPENYGRNINDYPNLKAKATGLKHVLITYYPSLAETEALKNIK